MGERKSGGGGTREIKTTMGALRGGRGLAGALAGTNHVDPGAVVTLVIPDTPNPALRATKEATLKATRATK